MFHRLPRRTVKNLGRRTAGAGLAPVWPTPKPHTLRLRRPAGAFSRLLRPLGAAVGAAMIGGAGAASLLNAGAVPVLAPMPQPGEEAMTAALARTPATAPRLSRAEAPVEALVAPGADAPTDASMDASTDASTDDYTAVAVPDPAGLPRFGALQVSPASPGPDFWAEHGLPDGAHYRNQPRLYLFAAIGDEAVGMNYLRDGQCSWRRDGWSRDNLSASGDAQVGLGWRKGPVQLSLAYVYRRTRTEQVYETLILPRQENRVALTLSVKP